MKTKAKIQDEISDSYSRVYRISRMLLAWGLLLEEQRQLEGYSELDGLGLSLQSYSRQLLRVYRVLDGIGIELARLLGDDRPARK